jgi:hypothetical protein
MKYGNRDGIYGEVTDTFKKYNNGGRISVSNAETPSLLHNYYCLSNSVDGFCSTRAVSILSTKWI